ncbi:MAG: site-determining protein [Gammaproteobacteria bacterium]|nr:MAG: site-determining protein [Gammaproteobacteria bacterium]
MQTVTALDRSGPRPVQVIAVSGGKGGVGKTNVAVNLAVAMARRGRKVMLLDADLGLANVDVLLGLKPPRDIRHVIDGACTLDDILIEGPAGVRIVPAASGVHRLTRMNERELAGLIYGFSQVRFPLDTLLVDTAAGIGPHVLSFCRAAQHVMVVVCDEPTALADAYALIKVLGRDYGVGRCRVVVNMAASEAQARAVFARLLSVVTRFLDVTLDYAGMVPFDEQLRKAVQARSAVVEAYPRARASEAFRRLAATVDGWPLLEQASGHVQFFLERLVGADALALAG